MNIPTCYSRTEAARRLTERGFKLSPATLQKYATTGGGPAYHIFGNRAVYTEQALEEWIEQRMGVARRSTSEAA